MSYEDKFKGFIKAIEQMQVDKVSTMIVSEPKNIGDSYEEVVESLNRIGEAGLSLSVLPPEGNIINKNEEQNVTLEPQEWIDSLISAVTDCIFVQNVIDEFRFKYYFNNDMDCWDIIMYPAPIELMGGARDGEIVSPPFSLDVGSLGSVFEKVDSMLWSALGSGPWDNEGQRIFVEGVYQGHKVCLRVLARPWDNDEDPSERIWSI